MLITLLSMTGYRCGVWSWGWSFIHVAGRTARLVVLTILSTYFFGSYRMSSESTSKSLLHIIWCIRKPGEAVDRRAATVLPLKAEPVSSHWNQGLQCRRHRWTWQCDGRTTSQQWRSSLGLLVSGQMRCAATALWVKNTVDTPSMAMRQLHCVNQ